MNIEQETERLCKKYECNNLDEVLEIQEQILQKIE